MTALVYSYNQKPCSVCRDCGSNSRQSNRAKAKIILGIDKIGIIDRGRFHIGGKRIAAAIGKVRTNRGFRAKDLSAACGRYSENLLAPRSKKSRISVSPTIFSGTARGQFPPRSGDSFPTN